MDLPELRDMIADIDGRIIELMASRVAAAEEIGRIKRSRNLPIVNTAVEERVISRYTSASGTTGLSEGVLEKVARAFIQEAVEHQVRIPDPNIGRMSVSVIGGGRGMGAWVADTLAKDGHDVAVIEPTLGDGPVTFDVSESDIIVVSVPIVSTKDVLKELDSVCRDDALIFDLSPLKSPFTDVLKDMASRRRVCSIHPIFGPLVGSMYGRSMIVCDCGNDEATDAVVSLFNDRGGRLRVMDVGEHDRYVAYTLGLGHTLDRAYFTTLDRGGIAFEDIVAFVSDPLVSIAKGSLDDVSGTHYGIRHMYPYGEEALERFLETLSELRGASKSDDGQGISPHVDKSGGPFENKM